MLAVFELYGQGYDPLNLYRLPIKSKQFMVIGFQLFRELRGYLLVSTMKQHIKVTTGISHHVPHLEP